jgi:RND family efflux transporter MFP subunit
MNTKTVLVTAAGLAAVVGLGSAAAIAYGPIAAEPAQEVDPRQGPQRVQVAIVRPAAPAQRAFTGIVAPRVKSNLGFRVSGKVVERRVDVGQRVQAGEPLLRLDQEDLALALKAKEKAVVAARAVAVQARGDEARYRKLITKGWVTRHEYDQVKAALDRADAELAVAEAEAQVERNEAGYSLLLADAEGTIIATLAEPGQVVAAGQTVIELAHAGPREATVDLPETVRPALGSMARARLYGDRSAPAPARLRQLADAANPLTRTFEARYVLTGAAAQAPLGATVTVWVPSRDPDPATTVPLGALYDDGAATGVWVVDPASSAVAFRPVRVHRLAEESAVVSGVESGETVVAIGAHLLQQGEHVRAAETVVAGR